ncbi:phospholipase A2 inhibitor gamma subunit A-like [Ranitomeya variabilis]|uniref:phospholipase A2 inhibitor gamma subunit A-like n=1 Tax=Ranitomeya variabilis TaxID=490064 RepID=UPI004055CCD8
MRRTGENPKTKSNSMKMKTYLTLFFIALIGAAHGIKCKRCWVNDYTQCCNEKEIDCPGSKCMTVSEYCKCKGVEFNTMQKTCAIEELCGVCYSASNIHGFQLRVSNECGDGERSNADLNFKKICEDPLPLNKYKCPSCFLTNTTKGCTAEGEMICGGTETKCFRYGGTLQLSNGQTVGMSVQGCITELGCKYEYKPVPGVREIDRDHFICEKAKTI